MKLSFKIENPTGQYRSFYHARCTVKADGEKVGLIIYSEKENVFKLMLHVAIPTVGNCKFKNVTLKKQFEGVSDKSKIEAGKEWVKANWEHIQSCWPLHKI